MNYCFHRLDVPQSLNVVADGHISAWRCSTRTDTVHTLTYRVPRAYASIDAARLVDRSLSCLRYVDVLRQSIDTQMHPVLWAQTVARRRLPKPCHSLASHHLVLRAMRQTVADN